MTRMSEVGSQSISGMINGGRITPARETFGFHEAQLVDVDLSGAVFASFHADGGLFERCDFTRAIFSDRFTSSLSWRRNPTVFRDCIFDHADLREVDIGQSRFIRCSFRNAKIIDLRSEAGEFIDCVFEGPVREAVFYGRPPDVPWRTEGWLAAPRQRNEFHGNDFRHAELIGCSFRSGVDLDAQLLPEGPDYLRFDRWYERVACARRQLLGWAQDAARREAELVLKVWGDPRDEQGDLFVRRADWADHAGVNALIELLESC